MDRKSAVSLVELAVVILILGILVAVVSAGSRLVTQSKMQSIMNDVADYKRAFNSFHANYGELPGDMTDESASAWFGVTNFSRTGSQGDGYIQGASENPMAFWHMQLAELLDDSYDGDLNTNEVPGVDIGRSGYHEDAGFSFFTLGLSQTRWGYATSASVYNMSNVVVLGFGKVRLGHSDLVSYAVLTPSEALNLDKKFDDGFPHKGSIMADHGRDVGSDTQCMDYSGNADDYTPSDGYLEYLTSDADVKCRMMFVFSKS